MHGATTSPFAPRAARAAGGARLAGARQQAGAALARLVLPLVAAAGCATSAPAGARDRAPVDLVEEALAERGLRFGTDGTVGSLLAYMQSSQRLVHPTRAQPGDVVFFSVVSDRCADHAGVVEEVEPGGRIVFREARGGAVRRSFASPWAPALRRGPDGRILNTFLRARRREDPPHARYHAGEMLCAVGRARADRRQP